MTEKSNLPSYLLEHTLWENEVNPIWLSTTFTLHRNLAKYNFPPKTNASEIVQICGLLKEQLNKNSKLEQPIFISAEALSPLDKEFLFEHFLCQEGFQNTLAGQGFAVDRSGNFFAEVNIENHLQLHLIDGKGSWEKAWNHLNQIEMGISEAVEFAFSPKFGYLTSDPSLCGTGLTVQAFLHLPALIHTQQLQETLLKQNEQGVTFSGMRGTLEDLVGDIVVIGNRFTLGESEEEILHSIHSTAMKLMALEKTVRSHLKSSESGEIKDQISRSLGLLLHSYHLQAKEALDALSLIKLGVSLGWILGITDEALNHLFFQCRKAHLLHLIGNLEITDLQEIAHKRAEFLHKHMHDIKLTFEL